MVTHWSEVSELWIYQLLPHQEYARKALLNHAENKRSPDQAKGSSRKNVGSKQKKDMSSDDLMALCLPTSTKLGTPSAIHAEAQLPWQLPNLRHEHRADRRPDQTYGGHNQTQGSTHDWAYTPTLRHCGIIRCRTSQPHTKKTKKHLGHIGDIKSTFGRTDGGTNPRL